MNTLSRSQQVLILRCLVDGMSLRATTRVTGAARNTVARLAVETGKVCADYQDRVLRNLSCQRIQVDEIWSFVYAKKRNVPRAKSAPPDAGDVWTWVALCADTKLAPSWWVGDRSADTANAFITDLRARLAHRVQLTSDGYQAYLEAVKDAFGDEVDYARLVKLYGNGAAAGVTGQDARVVSGKPDPTKISTSYVERQNLTMRMSMRRFTRLTNGFSKKLGNHCHAIALHFFYYNFCRIHASLPGTPAMAAGVENRLWEVGDLVDLVMAAQPKPNRPKTYKKGEISN